MSTTNTINSLNTAATSQAPGAGNTKKSISDVFQVNLEDFLLLLTTQLQHQDPLEPMDPSQFTEQLTTMSGVATNIEMSQTLGKMLELQEASADQDTLTNVANYIGMEAQIDGNELPLYNGYGKLHYDVPEDMASVSIRIIDSKGQTVDSGDGYKTKGDHTIVWDGRDLNGELLPNDVYRVYVTGKDAEGNSINIPVKVSAIVTSVSNSDDGVQVNLGDKSVSVDDIIRISIPNTQEI